MTKPLAPTGPLRPDRLGALVYSPFRNYVWNLALNIALNTGGRPGEVDEVVRGIDGAGSGEEDTDVGAFCQAWAALGDRLVALAEEDIELCRSLSAGEKLWRAAVYYQTGERLQHRFDLSRPLQYRKVSDAFDRAVSLGALDCEQLDVPYEDSVLPALFEPARCRRSTRAPAMVLCNGLDSTKEMLFGSGLARKLSQRGVATLIVDQPGTGAALRLNGLTGYAESERWAAACIDLLAARPDVDPARIGIGGWSLGGYYAPRAAAFEQRFALCVSWGANYDWGELQRRRLEREGERPVPHYWDHVQWVFGKSTLEEFMQFAPSMSLVGVVERIAVPYLITHGAEDRQIPADDARRQFAAATASPKAELKWFTDREGGVEHVSADEMANATSYIADWVGENL